MLQLIEKYEFQLEFEIAIRLNLEVKYEIAVRMRFDWVWNGILWIKSENEVDSRTKRVSY